MDEFYDDSYPGPDGGPHKSKNFWKIWAKGPPKKDEKKIFCRHCFYLTDFGDPEDMRAKIRYTKSRIMTAMIVLCSRNELRQLAIIKYESHAEISTADADLVKAYLEEEEAAAMEEADAETMLSKYGFAGNTISEWESDMLAIVVKPDEPSKVGFFRSVFSWFRRTPKKDLD